MKSNKDAVPLTALQLQEALAQLASLPDDQTEDERRLFFGSARVWFNGAVTPECSGDQHLFLVASGLCLRAHVMDRDIPSLRYGAQRGPRTEASAGEVEP